MDTLSSIISFLLYVLVAVPVCLVLHELGHAGMVLLVSRQKVTFQFGVRGTKWEFHFGRLTILLYLERGTFLGSRYQLEARAELTKSQILWMILGGPLASLLLTILCGGVWWATNRIDPWRGLTIINLINFLWTIIPQHYPEWQGAQAGFPNDGLQIIQLLRSSG
ncbi:MAG TPA: hypothetical protein VK249_06615 [Anaerolineales bacterium]|nr:hypothetical protein [Anaerolineales bacterium]